ncbi:MAG: MaoC family dehydratase, partial [Myxococcota bacterium]
PVRYGRVGVGRAITDILWAIILAEKFSRVTFVWSIGLAQPQPSLYRGVGLRYLQVQWWMVTIHHRLHGHNITPGSASLPKPSRGATHTMTTFANPDVLLESIGTDLGTTGWLTVEQDRIQQFADATGDHQWIHVDRDKSKAESPYGDTIAHGFLTLSLCAPFLLELLTVEQCSMGINYGLNKVRFPAPVKVGSRIRCHGSLASADEVKGGVQVVIRLSVEIEDGPKPACVAEWVCRYLR